MERWTQVVGTWQVTRVAGNKSHGRRTRTLRLQPNDSTAKVGTAKETKALAGNLSKHSSLYAVLAHHLLQGVPIIRASLSYTPLPQIPSLKRVEISITLKKKKTLGSHALLSHARLSFHLLVARKMPRENLWRSSEIHKTLLSVGMA